MNPKVEEFINKMKKEKEFEEQKKREELLKSLGLIDDRGYSLEVTDEEYREILKYIPDKKSSSKVSNFILIVAIIFMIIGIMGGLILVNILNSFIPIIYVAIYALICFPFVMGFARIVEASEKYLNK